MNLNFSPYNDDYDSLKKFVQLLAVPGRGVQAREFTQIQSLLKDMIGRVSDTLYKDGSIISGMSFSVVGNTLTIEDGRVYLGGTIHLFSKQSIEITNSGTELIGAKLEESIVSEESEISFRDPAQGYTNYNQPGCHRLKQDVKLTLNDPTAPTLYSFIDGVLVSESVTPSVDVITDILARRTYDESGNYKVEGLTLSTVSSSIDNVTLEVREGKAYIRGYEISKPATRIEIPKSKNTRTIIGEPKLYKTSNTNKYYLNNNPVNEVIQVRAEVRVTEEVHTRGSQAGGIDPLNNTSVTAIESVTIGATTYIQGTDYQLTNDSVDWSLNIPMTSKEPQIGQQYKVTYRYNKVMTVFNASSNTGDYAVITEGTEHLAKSYIEFTAIGDRPVDSTNFTVDYKFYLARKDLISIDKTGMLSVTTGQSNVPSLVLTPSNNDVNILPIGTVYLPPNGSSAIVNSYAVTRMKMEDIQRMMMRIEDLEYNQAVTALDQEAMEGELPTDLKGVFSDGFFSLIKGDLSFTNGDGSAGFTASYDLPNGNLVLPTTGVVVTQPLISNAGIGNKTWGHLVTAPMSEVKSITQFNATTTMLVNPYNVFNIQAVLALSPQIDNWVEETKISADTVQTRVFSINRWWYHGGHPWTDTEWYLFNNLILDAGQSWNGWDNKSGWLATTQQLSRTILDEAILYMRQREVVISCSNLLPNADNLELYFNSQKVSLSTVGIDGAIPGSTTGTIKANANGVAKGKFTIPANTPCGTREVSLKNSNNLAVSSYTANGRKRTVEEAVLRTRVIVDTVDPLAQAFQYDEDRLVTSVGIYFATKDASKSVRVQLRGMTNGYPNNVVHAEEVVSPASIKIPASNSQLSDDALSETKVTFRNPVLCRGGEQYCFTILSDSNAYSVYIANLGEKSLIDGQYVTKQPYLEGAMFSSSNAITWTAHQASDLKFNIYHAEFESSGTIEFEPIEGLSVDRLVLFTDYLTPQNTGCSWEVKVNNGDWEPIGNYEDKDLSSVATAIRLRAIFAANKYMSPLLATDSWSLVGFLTGQSASYVSRQIPLTQNFTTIKQTVDGFIPSNCSVTPKFSVDGGVTWQTGTLQSTQDVGNGWTRMTYSHTFGTAQDYNTTAVRVSLIITSPNQIVRPRARKFMNVIK